VLGQPLKGYHGITTGVPTRDDHRHASDAGVDDEM
jgi:hypothetical protein